MAGAEGKGRSHFPSHSLRTGPCRPVSMPSLFFHADGGRGAARRKEIASSKHATEMQSGSRLDSIADVTKTRVPRATARRQSSDLLPNDAATKRQSSETLIARGGCLGSLDQAVLLICVVVMVGSVFWLIFTAFEESWLWGFACLLLPFAMLLFVILHWKRASRSVAMWAGSSCSSAGPPRPSRCTRGSPARSAR